MSGTNPRGPTEGRGQSHFAPKTPQNWDSPRRYYRRFVLAAALAVVILVGGGRPLRAALASPPPAADADAKSGAGTRIERVNVGFGGQYKLGYWTPLSVRLGGVSPDAKLTLQVTVPDGDGVPSRVAGRIRDFASVPRPTATDVMLYVKIGRNTGEMDVAVRDGDRVLARRTFDLCGGELPPAMAAGDPLVLMLGRTRHLAKTLAADRRFKAAGGRVAEIDRTADLPDKWYGYEGVDAVVITGRGVALPDAQAAALDEWLRRRGTLLMSIGAEAETLLKPAAPLARWLPGRFVDIVSLTKTGDLEHLSGVNSALETLTEGEVLRLSAARLVDLHGGVLAAATERGVDVPLVVEGLYGFGRLRFVAVDLDQPLFGRWSGTAPLLNHLLLPQTAAGQNAASDSPGEVTHAGYTDLSGQLRAALDQFQNRGVRLLPFGLLFAIVFAYIVLLGPGDYLLLKHLLRRMEATWITFPLLVVLSCCGAYALAAWMKGDRLHVNQLDMLDFDQVGHARRATSWFTIFSPRSRAYDLTLVQSATDARATPATGTTEWSGRGFMEATNPNSPSTIAHPPSPILISWFGLPGTALGGMQSRVTSSFAARPYDFAPALDRLREVPIPIWSTKSFVAAWSPAGEPPVAANLAASQNGPAGLVTGSITNRSGVRLENCVLLTGDAAYRLGTLESGVQLAIGEDLSPRPIAVHLRRREPAEDYDPYDLDLPRIIEMMSFYERAGGLEYTRLQDRYEQFVDLSGELRAGRAVFVGLARQAAAEIRDSGAPLAATPGGRTTVYRVVLRVNSVERPTTDSRMQP